MKTQLICIGGWGFNNSVFDFICNHLKKDFERIDISTTQLDMAKMDRERKKIIITWSLGFPYFLEHLDKFTNIIGVVSLSPTAKLLNSDDFTLGWHPKILNLMITKLQINFEQVLSDFCSNCSSHSTLDKFLFNNLPQNQYHISLDYLASLDKRNTLDQLTMPIVFIHGESDKIISYKNSVWLHNKIRHSEFHIIPGDHMIIKQSNIIEIIQQFIGRNDDR